MTGRAAEGQQAEQLDEAHLCSAGLRTQQRNYRCRFGELDLIMRDGDTLVVAEVRKRSHSAFGGAAASVTSTKQQRIVRATRQLLAEHPSYQKLAVRFDVIAIGADNQIDWIQSAFDAH